MKLTYRIAALAQTKAPVMTSKALAALTKKRGSKPSSMPDSRPAGTTVDLGRTNGIAAANRAAGVPGVSEA